MSKQNLRIAIVLSELRAGGMERVVVHLAQGLCRCNFETIVICMEKAGALSSELQLGGVRLSAINSVRSMDIGAVLRLHRILKNFSPDIINIHDYASTPYTVIANQTAVSAPIIFTAHGLLYTGFGKLQTRYRFFSNWFSGLTAVSEEVAGRHRGFLNWSKPITIIPNGVPSIDHVARSRAHLRNEFGCKEGCVLFLAVGNPRPEKGFEDLIDAVAILHNHYEHQHQFLVVVAGELDGGPYCQSLQNRLRDRGLNTWCRFIGFRADTLALYSAADAFVLSSRSEGLPMVILEAMMAGLPVIATRVGGVPNAVGDYGVLTPPGQPSELAKAMTNMFTNREWMQSLGQSGRKHARKIFGVNRMVDAYINYYHAQLNRRPPR